MRKIEKTPYEFYLYINGNIIVQRYFNIKGYNSNALRSMEIREMIDDIDTMIQNDFKKKTEDYLYTYYNPYDVQLESDIQRTNIFEVEDFFDIEVKVNDKTAIIKRFSGNVYPPKVRYSTNIRELIPDIIYRIQDTLSQKKYEMSYGELAL